MHTDILHLHIQIAEARLSLLGFVILWSQKKELRQWFAKVHSRFYLENMKMYSELTQSFTVEFGRQNKLGWRQVGRKTRH